MASESRKTEQDSCFVFKEKLNNNLAGTITSLQAKFLRTMNVLCVTYR